MTTAVQRRRGTTVQHSTFTGLEGEVTIDTTKDTIVVHDGSTAGGIPILREDFTNGIVSGLGSINGADTADNDQFLIFDTSSNSIKKISRAELNNAIEQDPLSSVAITGGTINNTSIGATTPSTGAFTTLSATGNVTLSGGTANGVAYLNGSKVLTTGSALTFDASTLLVNAANTSYRGQISLQGGASDFAQITFYRGGTTDTDQVGYVHSLNSAGSSQAMVIGARNGAFLKFDVSDSEQARLNTTGLALGTSTVLTKLTVNATDGITMQRSTDNSFAGVLDYLKSRGSSASPSGVADGDGLFLLRVAPHNGSSFTYLNSMYVEVDGAYTTGQNPPTRLVLATNAANGSSAARVIVDSSGRVGVNTTETGYGNLVLSRYASAPQSTFALGNFSTISDDVGIYLRTTSTAGISWATGGSMAFYGGGPGTTERGRFTSDGVFVVGASSSATGFGGIAQIEASGSNGGIIINSSSTGASDYSRLIFTKSNASGNEGLIRYNTNDYHMAFWTNATEKGRFSAAGNFIVGTSAFGASADPRVSVNSKGYYYWGSASGLGDFYVGNGSYGISMGVALGGGGAGTCRIWTQNNGTQVLTLGVANQDKLIVYPTQVVVQSSADATLTVSSSAAAFSSTLELQSSSAGSGSISTSEYLRILTNSTERVRFNKTGAMVFNGGTVNADGIGITFPATQSASSNANTLDDYERGTWTPTIVGSGGGSTTPTQAIGTYTKIGNTVRAYCYIVFPPGTLSGTLTLQGFPFAAAEYEGAAVTYWNGFSSSFVNMSVYMIDATTNGTIVKANAASTTMNSSLNASDLGGVSNEILVTLVYQATA